uniref:Glycosyltransferase family 92 protein n=1 Tax=Caenorhabditis tropicalis TaxID=1561998 RepID=A0A1I7UU59_9PELO
MPRLIFFGIAILLLVWITSHEDATRPYSLLDAFHGEGIRTKLHENLYCIGYNFLESRETFRESDGLEPVTLATHGTSDMLKTIENMPDMWDGPISIGLYLDSQTSNALDYLANVHRCILAFREKMTIHFAFKISAFQTTCPTVIVPKPSISCDDFLRDQEALRKSVSAPFTLYPCSLMRNVARWGAKSDIHFVMDGDMIVSEGMAQRVKKVANEMIDGHRKVVLLVRRFENDVGTVIPRSFPQLQEALRNNRLFSVPAQECAVIGSFYDGVTVPEFIQIYKLCRANYTFHLLSHVFDVHEGIKLAENTYSQAAANHQIQYARRGAKQRYEEEMNRLYPLTQEKCGVFKF